MTTGTTPVSLEEKCPFLIDGQRNFFGIDLSSRLLRKSDLSFLILGSSKLFNCDLERSTFVCASLCYADITASNLKGCDFRGADLSHAILVDANLSDSIFDEKTILPFKRKEAERRGMIFRKSRINLR